MKKWFLGKFFLLIMTCCLCFEENDTNKESSNLWTKRSPIGDFSSLQYFPRNITDTYKGSWINSNFTQNFGLVDFQKRSGHILLQISNKKTNYDGMDAVYGEMRLRDGIYSTDNYLGFSLQGVYFYRYGVIFLVANPEGHPIVEDFVLEMSKNTTFLEAVDNAIQTYSKKLSNNNIPIIQRDRLPCYFTLLFQMKPVALDFNEKYSYFYERRYKKGDEESSKPQLEMGGKIKSASCNISLDVEALTLSFDLYYTKAINYVVMVAISSFVQIILLIRQIEYSNTQTGASKVSLIMIGIQAMMDSYLCLIHLTGGIVIENIFNAFATAAFFQFIGFSVFEMRYLFIIWKARRPQSYTEIRREFGILYARFYSCLMIGFLLVYYLNRLFQIFLFLMYSFLVPQIVCNVYRGTNNALTKQYILGTVITRCLIPLYMFGCPYNFLHIEPNYKFIIYFISWMIFQVTILLLQDFLGPHFFIPKQLLPPRYDYQRIIHQSDDSPECVICMSPVDLSTGDYMITPCEHIFHQSCLSQWMEKKMECPTCRGALPTV